VLPAASRRSTPAGRRLHKPSHKRSVHGPTPFPRGNDLLMSMPPLTMSGISYKLFQGNTVQNRLAGRRQNNRRGRPMVQRLFPARCAQTPTVSRFQPRESMPGVRGRQAISSGLFKFQEIFRHDAADTVNSGVIAGGPARAVLLESGDRSQT